MVSLCRPRLPRQESSRDGEDHQGPDDQLERPTEADPDADPSKADQEEYGCDEGVFE
jgi:hypothetical protein